MGLLCLPVENAQFLALSSRLWGPSLSSWRRILLLEDLLMLAKETCSGRETFLQQLSTTWRVLQPRISRVTLARLSMTFTRLLTSCLVTCPREIIRREQSTGLLPRLS